MSKRTKIILGLVGGVVVVGALTAFIRGKDKDVPRVTTAKVEKMDLVSKVTANGKIQARRKVDLSALVMGQIVNLAVKEGDTVKKGQLLLQIDRAQLAAQAQGRGSQPGGHAQRPRGEPAQRPSRPSATSTAPSELQGKHPLRGGAAEGARRRYDTAQAQPRRHRAAHAVDERATSRASRDSLSKTTVTSPLDGIVTFLPVKEGEVTVIGTMNNPGTQLMTISDMVGVEAVMMVDETSVPNVDGGPEGDALDRRLPEPEVRGHGHRGGLVADRQERPRPPGADGELRSDQLQGEDPARQSAAHDPARLLGDRRRRHGPAPGRTTIPIQALVVRDVPAKEQGADGRIPGRDRGGRVHRQGRQARLREGQDRASPASSTIEVTKGPKVGEDIVTGPSRSCARSRKATRSSIEKERQEGADKKGGPKPA